MPSEERLGVVLIPQVPTVGYLIGDEANSLGIYRMPMTPRGVSGYEPSSGGNEDEFSRIYK